MCYMLKVFLDEKHLICVRAAFLALAQVARYSG